MPALLSSLFCIPHPASIYACLRTDARALLWDGELCHHQLISRPVFGHGALIGRPVSTRCLAGGDTGILKIREVIHLAGSSLNWRYQRVVVVVVTAVDPLMATLAVVPCRAPRATREDRPARRPTNSRRDVVRLSLWRLVRSPDRLPDANLTARKLEKASAFLPFHRRTCVFSYLFRGMQ